jgi:hypothetical protein
MSRWVALVCNHCKLDLNCKLPTWANSYLEYKLVEVVIKQRLAVTAFARSIPLVVYERLVALRAVHGGNCLDVNYVT